MKNVLVAIALLTSIVSVSAQWSVGVDARLAPFGETLKRYAGTDIVLNYSYDFCGSLYLMPSVGLFYKNYYDDNDWVGGPGRKGNDYQTGIDFSIVAGKKFLLNKGFVSIFTGPRYGYAFVTNFYMVDPNRNSFDWRIGAAYKICKFLISAKFDIGCLNFAKDDLGYKIIKYSPTQTLVLGVAYDF